MNPARLRSTLGMTVVEMLITLVVFSVVVASVLSVMRSQAVSFTRGTLRMGVVQNLRFTAGFLERELRTVGAGVLEQQPFLVYAGADVVAFNANFATDVAGDVFAVYHDPDLPAGAATVMTPAQRTVLPGTGFAYPDTLYREGSAAPSTAETIVFFVRPDTTTARADDHALYRQVNGLTPELVARNLLRTDGGPFFTYFRLVAPSDSPARIEAIPGSALPLAHSAPIHLSAADTGRAAVIDSVRGVQIRFTATDGSGGPDEQTRSLARLIWLPNAGLATRQTCGDAPILGTGLAAAAVTLDDGRPAARLQWNPAVDEDGGEQDVVRYVVWRRPAGDPSWGDPYLSLPAGSDAYEYIDATVESGGSYEYGLAAQDCTPLTSATVPSGAVAIP